MALFEEHWKPHIDDRLADLGAPKRPDPTKPTPNDMAKARATFQGWADDDEHLRKQVDEVFHDRRHE